MEKYELPKSPDLTSRHIPSIAGDENIAVVLEESQKSFPNHSDEPKTSSRIPHVCNIGGKFTEKEKELSKKKKLCDKAYRERLKLRRKETESFSLRVCNENEDLKRENERLRSEKDLMDQNLQAIAAEIQRLKTKISSLRGSKEY